MDLPDNWEEIVYSTVKGNKYILQKDPEMNTLECFQIINDYLHFKEMIFDIDSFLSFLFMSPDVTILKIR